MLDKILPQDLYDAPFLNSSGIATDIGPSIFFAPHPDDESLGCGGMIAMLRAAQVPVTVVFMTSGSASHPNSKEYPAKKLAKTREQEAQAACAALGVEDEKVFFLHRQDSQMPFLLNSEYSKLKSDIAAIVEQSERNTVFVPWRRDPHGDHIASTKVILETLKEHKIPVQIVEYPVWLWKNGKPHHWPDGDNVQPFRLNISSVKNKKEKAIFCHQTQTSKLIADDPEGFILTPDLLEPFLGDYEYYLFSPGGNEKTLTSEYFNRLYSDNNDPWNFENSHYEHEKYERSILALGERTYESTFEIGCSIGVLSEKLAQRTKKLLSIDISGIPINAAKERCAKLDHVSFEVMDVSRNFPNENFDLIVMSEVGYYLEKENLLHVFNEINTHLLPGGNFLMVHWTSYVGDYPLTGKQVHLLFEQFAAGSEAGYSLKTKYVHENYELVLYEKKA